VSDLGSASVVIIGAGGIGAPLAIALVAGGVRRFTVVDDDDVDVSNLHRQILFTAADVGRPKLDAFAAAVERRAPGVVVTRVPGRALPSTVGNIVAGASVVVDATDNFASRFLLADACALAKVPVVHAAAVRWQATVLAVPAAGRPCYRCLFEDVPRGDAPDCATAGVVGPVCGVAGAVAADRALRILAGDTSAYGHIVTYDGLRDALRSVPVPARPSCALCGSERAIHSILASRYLAPACGL
jgi:molybdopterin/thiamine biosynthesis adenylyltransferase